MKRMLWMIPCLLLGEVQAGELWNWNAASQTTLMHYAGSQQRNAAGEMGVLVSADYLDDGGFTLGYTRTAVQLQQAAPNVNQHALFVATRRHVYLDSARGIVTLRADGHGVKNDDATGLTDKVRTLALQAAYTVYDKQYYFDLGYALSRYNNRLEVKQYTPTVAYAMQDGFGWLQLRSYLIAFSEPALAQNVSRTRGLEAKYSYWLMPGSSVKPHSIQLGALVGARLFAVDMDAGTVGNLSDLQQGGLALGIEWKLGQSGKLLLLGGQNRYRNPGLDNSYRGNFLYANLNTSW